MNLFPHGYCLAWDWRLIILSVVGDLLTFASYLLLAILVFVSLSIGRTHALITSHSAWMWAAFIWSCSMTHLFAVFTVWQPIYVAAIALKLMTGAISAVAVWTSYQEVRGADAEV